MTLLTSIPSLNLTGLPPGTGQLVELADVKTYLNLHDDVHDAKLGRYIDAIRPLIEDVTGPIIPATFDEWHDGGQVFIKLRRRPSTAYGQALPRLMP